MSQTGMNTCADSGYLFSGVILMYEAASADMWLSPAAWEVNNNLPPQTQFNKRFYLFMFSFHVDFLELKLR